MPFQRRKTEDTMRSPRSGSVSKLRRFTKWLNHSRFSWRIKLFPRPERGCPTSGPQPRGRGGSRNSGSSTLIPSSPFLPWLGTGSRSDWQGWSSGQELRGAGTPGQDSGSHQPLTCPRLGYKPGFNAQIKEGFSSQGEEQKRSQQKCLVFPREAKMSP